jgi:hypothetical protein
MSVAWWMAAVGRDSSTTTMRRTSGRMRRRRPPRGGPEAEGPRAHPSSLTAVMPTRSPGGGNSTCPPRSFFWVGRWATPTARSTYSWELVHVRVLCCGCFVLCVLSAGRQEQKQCNSMVCLCCAWAPGPTFHALEREHGGAIVQFRALERWQSKSRSRGGGCLALPAVEFGSEIGGMGTAAHWGFAVAFRPLRDEFHTAARLRDASRCNTRPAGIPRDGAVSLPITSKARGQP